MFVYHVTKPGWLNDGSNRLAFRKYVRPANQPYRDHAPLNEAGAQHPGDHVYRAFFFNSESVARRGCFQDLAYSPHVVLRAQRNHGCFDGVASAPDDKEKTEGAHILYLVDSEEPEAQGDQMIHPTLGVPFAAMNILSTQNGQWQPLMNWQSKPGMDSAAASSDEPRRDHQPSGGSIRRTALIVVALLLTAVSVDLALHRHNKKVSQEHGQGFRQ